MNEQYSQVLISKNDFHEADLERSFTNYSRILTIELFTEEELRKSTSDGTFNQI